MSCSNLASDRSWQIDGPARAAWTLPYVVTVNDEQPYGMYVSHPSMFEGESEDDGRLKWYATASNKDIIMTAKVCMYI